MKIADGLLAGLSMALFMSACGEPQSAHTQPAKPDNKDSSRYKTVIVDTSTLPPVIDSLGEACPPCGRG